MINELNKQEKRLIFGGKTVDKNPNVVIDGGVSCEEYLVSWILPGIITGIASVIAVSVLECCGCCSWMRHKLKQL